MAPGFGRPMQLLNGEVDRFRELGRDGFSAYRQCNYEYGCCEVTLSTLNTYFTLILLQLLTP